MTEEAKLSDTEIIQGKVSIGKTHHTSKCRQALRAAFPYTIPIFAGYWFLGLTYGILMNVSGFSFVWPMVMAAVIYSGSVEFVAVKVLLSSFHPLQAFVMAFMIGARHLFYGVTMLDRFKHKGWKKPLLIYFMSDETFSVNYTAKIPKGVDEGWFMLWVTLLDFLYWLTGATLGGILAQGGLSVAGRCRCLTKDSNTSIEKEGYIPYSLQA